MIDAFIKYYEKSNCFICDRVLEKNDLPRWISTGVSTRAKQTTIHMVQACHICADMALHIADADREQIRYTRVGVGIPGNESGEGSRCACGSVTHAGLGFCIQCWKAHRMLDKAQAEARLISKALTELRKQIKSNKQAIAA